MEERYLTVTALTKYIKYKFDNDIHLHEVLLEGEISNFKHHSRGHFYFTLKDENAQISALMFSTNARNVLFEPEDGMKVFVKGSIQVYEASGTYQIYVREMKNNGVGDLYLAYEKLKKELEKAGYFNSEHKKKIPLFPKKIGVITSPTGAAIRDIINTITRRYPMCQIILYPALVQGEGAKESICNMISLANKQKMVDVLIVGRGGGSIEDLWAFNEKIVADAIYNSSIPIISAVGHEIDFSIADFVADVRAATPTAAAELATPNITVLKDSIKAYKERLVKAINNLLANYKIILGNLDRSLDANNPIQKIKDKKRIILDYDKHIRLLINSCLNEKKHKYLLLNQKLNTLNPLSLMEKGYSVISKDNKIISSVKDLKVDDRLDVALHDGKIVAKILEVKDGK